MGESLTAEQERAAIVKRLRRDATMARMLSRFDASGLSDRVGDALDGAASAIESGAHHEADDDG